MILVVVSKSMGILVKVVLTKMVAFFFDMPKESAQKYLVKATLCSNNGNGKDREDEQESKHGKARG